MTRALVVDDDARNVYLLRALLEANGFAVREAANGEQALRLARKDAPDLVIADLLMPVMDGYMLLQEWRADPNLAPIPFIVLTATYVEEQDSRLALRMGADTYCLKPIEPEPFMAIVNDLLEQARTGPLPSKVRVPPNPPTVLEAYSRTLVRKLEQKIDEANARNRELRAEMAERERVEQQLRASEERFRAAFEQAAVGIAHMDWSGRFIWVNDRLCQMGGYSREELLQRNFTDLTVTDDLPKTRALLDAIAAGEVATYSVERRYLRKDGRTLWADLHVTVMRNEGGAPTHVLAVVVDITSRREAEEALKLHERAIQSVPQGILITDPRLPDNPIVYASDGFTRVTGYGAHDARGRNCRFLQGADTDRDAVAKLRQAVEHGQPCAVEILNYRRDGTPFWNALSITPVRGFDGTVEHYVGVQTDVTDRRQLEDQLRAVQKMEAIGRLAGGIAHDFNNLLTAILGYADMLVDDAAIPEPVRDDLAEIRKAAASAAALTRQLLAFSRQQVLEHRVLSLNRVIRNVESILRRVLGEDIALVVVLEDELPSVSADPTQLEQVLMNMAVNARDAMPAGGQLRIATETATLDQAFVDAHRGASVGRQVMLTITDSGVGMDASTASRVFEPFFTTKAEGKGTGLGLSMVYGVIKQMGGSIWVTSAPGQGTTFTIYLPMATGQAAKVETRIQRPMRRGSETVLLVEDQPDVRRLTAQVLTRFGYTVLEAETPRRALQIARDEARKFDLLLTDVVMPEMSGRDLARELGQSHQQLRVLYSSGYTDDAIVQHGILEPGLAFLQKPFTPDALLRKVRDVLEAADPPAL